MSLFKKEKKDILKEMYIKKYLKNRRIVPNKLPIIELIYFFRLICKNNNISIQESLDLSHIIRYFFEPPKKIFEDYCQKNICKNSMINTPFGFMYFDKIEPKGVHHYGYDIVSTFGLSRKLFNKYKNKYFYVKYFSSYAICIDFFDEIPEISFINLEPIQVQKLELTPYKRVLGSPIIHYACNLIDMIQQCKDFDSFQREMNTISQNYLLSFWDSSVDRNYCPRKLLQIYHIYKKKIFLST